MTRRCGCGRKHSFDSFTQRSKGGYTAGGGCVGIDSRRLKTSAEFRRKTCAHIKASCKWGEGGKHNAVRRRQEERDSTRGSRNVAQGETRMQMSHDKGLGFRDGRLSETVTMQRDDAGNSPGFDGSEVEMAELASESTVMVAPHGGDAGTRAEISEYGLNPFAFRGAGPGRVDEIT